LSNRDRLIGIIASTGNSCYDEINNVIVYPNPANNELYVKLTNNSNSWIEIINDNGQLVFSSLEKPNNSNIIKIETANLAMGVYAIKIINDSKPFIRKVLINH
jgi:hypothetical protein